MEDEPEQNLDVTPVYGSLKDRLEWAEGGFTVTAIGVDGAGGGMLAGNERVNGKMKTFRLSVTFSKSPGWTRNGVENL